ncbi:MULTISPECIES: phosphate/phosphite/phosphonate ABC transporter substrate-binding protein [unclassified Okeania]|uniref:phosphate/phosphite/phosphonate ABC transporter substrate-binding protein n=1 Tax=unclassified Okeania TaxID=2634635 RepID=UPI0013BCFCCF|nr:MULTISPECIES: phosphate/phosphite/phosphonate ABC transporter substrate-binding protein [unclassified Okeania]NET14787.1 phosphate/phosphite/phosphonate ABC transporter substrate-binding protein [Okeania sp. SIO1H6]NES78682.1 phosphate/phosphite/phosphonate ABC transporter substrate-binding protein [Okeania sp. SIO1H4]NET22189.1 phosphate/phosphite/phosphonate ABC transporter substrate-binding protein [Okeania sp. SIO1H5]NET79062.1 phosphate/phosphite/phosphonate ABC transporter substrate-bi
MLSLILKKNFLIVVFLAWLGLVSCSNSNTQTSSTENQPTQADIKANPDKLVVALLPDESAATVIQNNKGLETYLENKLSKDIELFVSTDYSSMIEVASKGRLDLAYFGPLSYVLAKTKSNIEPFAALEKDGKTTYQALVIGNAESGIDSYEKIEGKVMAYGDQASTSSHLIPKSMLMEKGLKPGENYEEVFAGAHDAVAVAVANGKAQAGGLSKPIFTALVERGTIDKNKVIIIAESKPFPQYPWTMRSDLEPELKAQIQQAFLELEDEAILKPFKADGFQSITDEDYNVVRDLGKLLDLDFAELSK